MPIKHSFFVFARRRMLALVLAGLLLPMVPPVAVSAEERQDDPLVDTVSNGRGRINYSAGVVKATGYGAPPAEGVAGTPAQAKLMALGAARADALRTLAMTVSSIQVTAETKVKNYVLEKDEVRTSLSALLKSPRVVSEAMQADGTAVVVMELPLYGPRSVASIVYPEVLKNRTAPRTETEEFSAAAPSTFSGPGVRIASALPAGGAGADVSGNFRGPAKPAIKVVPPVVRSGRIYSAVEPGLTPRSDNGPFTSVLIDCRGLNVEAIMSPKIYDTTGREVYGTVRVTPEYAIDTGIVSYPRSMGEAIRSARAGAHPLIVRGIRTADRHRFNPVISMEDADRILAANNRDRFLEQTRVILLVDPVRY
ncbi:MAG: hypothetical protein SFU56_14080 [Capsulimonadales bacterium]|nr:hypothetical protein [Capsulimonadales bacterium]